MHRAPSAFLLSFCLASLGCAKATFAPGVKSVGEYKNLTATAAAADALPQERAEDVRVLVGTIPEGMKVEGGVLVVDPEKYEVLGRVEANLNNPLAANLGLWVYDYAPEDKWRVGLCAWQVPLSWVTFTVWAWISPTHYPCKANMGSDEDRAASIVATLKRAGKALGADLVVVPGIGGTVVVHGNGGSAVVDQVNATNAHGFAVKTKGLRDRPEVAPATAANTTL